MATNDSMGPGKAFRDHAEYEAAWAEFDKARSFEDDDEEGFDTPRTDPSDPSRIFLRPAPRSPGALRRNLALSDEERRRQLQDSPSPTRGGTSPSHAQVGDPKPALTTGQMTAREFVSGPYRTLIQKQLASLQHAMPPVAQLSSIPTGPRTTTRTSPPRMERDPVDTRLGFHWMQKGLEQTTTSPPASHHSHISRSVLSRPAISAPPYFSQAPADVNTVTEESRETNKNERRRQAERDETDSESTTSSKTFGRHSSTGSPRLSPTEPLVMQSITQAALSEVVRRRSEQAQRNKDTVSPPISVRPPLRTPPRLRLNDRSLQSSPSPLRESSIPPPTNSAPAATQEVEVQSIINQHVNRVLPRDNTIQAPPAIARPEQDRILQIVLESLNKDLVCEGKDQEEESETSGASDEDRSSPRER